jgi:AraC family L-rhamnose operon regulatory protein RhaS
MTATPAIFIEKEVVYHADKCDPLVSAAERGDLELSAWGRGTYPGKRLPEKCLQEVCSVGVWDASKTQNWGLNWHRNEGVEITYLEKGGLGFSVDDWEGQLMPGNLTVTRPWQKHRVGNPEVGASRLHWLILDVGVRQPHSAWQWPEWIILSPTDLTELTECLRGNEQPVWNSSFEIGECFRKIAITLQSEDVASLESRLKVQINQLLLSLLENQRHSQTALNPALTTVNRTVKYFLSQLPKYLDFEWDLTIMARQCGMARSQFTLHCRNLTNRTPMQYLAECRYDAARALLTQQSALNISEIAGICGFQTSQYFATQFRKRSGLSPLEFRKRHQLSLG